MNQLNQQYSKRELMEIFPEAREYLKEEEETAIIAINAFETIIKWKLEQISKIEDSFSRWFNKELLRVLDGAILDKWEKRLRKITWFLNPWPIDEKKGRITDEDILRAKEFPFDSLIEFNRAGFTRCPFHNEKTPSLSWNKKNNTIHCFGQCGKTWDTIQYLMDSEGIGFVEAVNKL